MNFKKMTALFALLAATSMFAKEFKFDGKFTGWIVSNRKQVVVDREVKPVGAAIRLENNSSIHRNLELEPDTKYKITFRIKGQDIASDKNKGARIMLNAGKHWERITATPQNEPDTRTFDWKEGSGIIDTAKFKSRQLRSGFPSPAPELCGMMILRSKDWKQNNRVNRIFNPTVQREHK